MTEPKIPVWARVREHLVDMHIFVFDVYREWEAAESNQWRCKIGYLKSKGSKRNDKVAQQKRWKAQQTKYSY